MPSLSSLALRRLLVICALVASAAGATWHAWLMDQHLTFVSGVQLMPKTTATPFERIRPGFTADASMWIRYATDVLEGKNNFRSHLTQVDNAPQGREVHWNSGLLAWLIGAGWLNHQITGLPYPTAVERAAVWANLPLLLLFMAGFTWWTWRRAGAPAAVLVAFCCFGQRWFYEGFIPSYLDHHGLISAAVAGLLLGVIFMGAGWLRPAGTTPTGLLALLPDNEAEAIRTARWAGFWGGFGMWISTASLAIPIALVASASLLGALACRTSLSTAGARVCSQVWRAWGRAGALTSVAFYLLEYFPFQMGWRLEVNHPVYALAWWAGSELVAELFDLIGAAPEQRPAAWSRVLWAGALALPAIGAPILLILARGPAVFALADPFMARLHDSIGEFLPMAVRIMGRTTREFIEVIGWKLLTPLAAVVLLLATRRRPHVLLLASAVTFIAMLAMGLFWQARWGTIAASAELPLVVVFIVVLSGFSWAGGTKLRLALTTSVALLLFYLVPIGQLLLGQTQLTQNKVVPPDHVLELVYRDIAASIIKSAPDSKVVLFTNPNASVASGYYGRFQTLGTLYWENADGLRKAAQLTCAPTDEAAEALVRQLGVTHVAVISEENFVLGYAKLLYPNITMDDLRRTFGARLLSRNIPVWLEPIVYTAPRGLPGNLASLEVDLYKVNFGQSFAQAYLNAANLFASRENFPAALDMLAQCAKHAVDNPTPLFLRAGILARLQRVPEALQDFERAFALVPAERRGNALTEAGMTLSNFRAFKESLAYYRRAIEIVGYDSVAANNLCWRLAVAADDTIRNPAEAMQLAQKIYEIAPQNPTVLDTYAASLAANGRYEEAVVMMNRAISLSQNAKNADLEKLFRSRLAVYELGRPWRE